jgi:hypothetical protein
MSWLDLQERDEQAVAAFMSRVAALPAPAASQLTPDRIWWKAQLLRRWDSERKVTAPLDFMQPVEVAAGLASLAFLLYRSLPYLF